MGSPAGVLRGVGIHQKRLNAIASLSNCHGHGFHCSFLTRFILLSNTDDYRRSYVFELQTITCQNKHRGSGVNASPQILLCIDERLYIIAFSPYKYSLSCRGDILFSTALLSHAI